MTSLGILFSLLIASTAIAAEPAITFPAESGVLDVRDFGATANDATDDTVAIQKALDAFPNGNRIIHLPPGLWIVSDTLRWPKGEGGNGEKRTIMQGAGRTLTTLRLPDATTGFAGDHSKALIWTGNKPAQRFRNAVRDLTIEIGSGNPQAIGLQFNVEHQGTMCRNNGGRLWILGMKTEKIGTIIETVNGGITDATGIFIYSNAGWEEGLPAFGASLYLRSVKDASRGKVLRFGVGRTLADAELLVPESDAVIEGITPTAKHLFVADLLGGPSRIRQFDLDGKSERELPLPAATGITGLTEVDERILFRQTSYVAPAAWMLYDPADATVKKTALFNTSPVDFSDIEAVRDFAISKDGK